MHTLGIDIGSISLKLALIDEKDEVCFSRWQRVAGTPIPVLRALLSELIAEYPDTVIDAIGVTGSGRELITAPLGAHSVNEITAQARACALITPEARTIIEIGGQDSKLIIFENDESRDIREFRMNELCAAGTGAFLDQQAARLGLSIERFAQQAADATDPVPIAGRCAVFAKTDMTHHQQEGRSIPDIVAGLNEALVRSYLAGLVRGAVLPRPIAFQGGVASNAGLVSAFQRLLGITSEEFIVPATHRVMGAIGAAHLASEQTIDRKTTPENILLVVEGIEEGEPTESIGRPMEPLVPLAPQPIAPDFSPLDLDGAYLGIDIGSVSVKFVVIDRTGVRHSDYRFSDGRPFETLRPMLTELAERRAGHPFSGVGITGSGREFIGRLIGADVIQNEITAQAAAAAFLLPNVDTVVEIGGQDAKFMRLTGDRAAHFAMNRVCAAGTGAFLQEQAARLGIDLKQDFAREAFASSAPATLGERCTVFMESDLVSHQQRGANKRDLIAGLALSVVQNYLDKVVSGHPCGERILFLGGVAENRAVAAALERMIGKTVTTSTLGTISGAIGAALAAFHARRAEAFSESRFRFDALAVEIETFTCEECPNRCRIMRIRGGRDETMGGRCGRWDASAAPKTTPGFNGVIERWKVMEQNPSHVTRDRQTPAVPSTVHRSRFTKIGIPRALLAFDLLPAWRSFFEALGCEIVLSPPTDAKLLADGMRSLVVETCLPMKAFCAHVDWLDRNGDIDFLFAPSIIITERDRHGRHTTHCPYIFSLPQFAQSACHVPMLKPAINWMHHPRDEVLAMEDVARTLGRSRQEGRCAWEKACAVQEETRAQLHRIGTEQLAALCAKTTDRAFLLIGKDYTLADGALSSDIATLIADRGEVVLTQDMCIDDSGQYSAAYESMYWHHGKEILAAAELCARTPNLHPVIITSFGCGPDSFTLRFVRDILKNTPHLVLEVDEHSSAVGMATRFEAFIDALPKERQRSTAPTRRAIRYTKPPQRVYLPFFSDHGYAFAAAIKTMGLEPILTDRPSRDGARKGMPFATTGECHPYVLMLGDYLKAAEEMSEGEDACYFMPEAGACRVGQFGAQMRLAAEDAGVTLPIFTRILDIVPAGSRRNAVKALSTYWEMMRGIDFYTQLYYETRAQETTPGTADRAHDEGLKLLWESIMHDSAQEGLILARDRMCAVPVDKTQQRFKIAVTGDYYTRVCDFANGEAFRDIERMGGMVMIPPTMTEFIKYDSRWKIPAAIHHRKATDLVQALAMRGIVDNREERMHKLFDEHLSYNVPLNYDRHMKLIEPYMERKYPSALIGAVAVILEQIEAGASGIVSLITFHCTYGLVIGAVLAEIKKRHPRIPILTLIFEGLEATHNRTRLEAFMERVKSRKR